MSIMRRNNNNSTLSQNYFQTEKLRTKNHALITNKMGSKLNPLQNNHQPYKLNTSDHKMNRLTGNGGHSVSAQGFRTKVEEG